MWAAEVGRLAGVRIPVVPMAGQYVVTPPDAILAARAPAPARPGPGHLRARGPRRRADRRRRRAPCAPWSLRGGEGLDEIPPDFNGRLLEGDRDGFAAIAAAAARRVPVLGGRPGGGSWQGPEAWTPDGEPCLGETAVRGLFVAAGLRGAGWRRRAASGA